MISLPILLGSSSPPLLAVDLDETYYFYSARVPSLLSDGGALV
jgi:hypothetical protein